MPDLDALFRPRSIVLVGASPDRTIIRGRIVEAVTLHGFGGPLYAVSRSHEEIRGIPCYRSVEALPGPVDLAIVTIPAEHVAATLRACGGLGVKAAIVISSGFGEERGEAGAARQREIADIARGFDMAVLGPNSEGFLNGRMPLAATFSPTVVHVEDGLRPEASRARGVAVVSQSGGVGFSFFHRGRPKALSFSFVVTMGNEAGVDATDVAGYLVEDDETAVVLAFIEGIRAPGKLVRVAERAAGLRKPLIVAKIGRSEAAAAAVASHTASLAGSARVCDAVFRRHGILSGEDQEHMVDVAAAFAFFPDRLPRGTRVGILTPSGGAGAWLADVCAQHGLTVPPLDPGTRAAIDRMLPAYGASRNPVDVTAQVIFTLGYAPALELLARAPGIDAVLVAGSLSHSKYIERSLEGLIRIGASVDKPVIFCGYTRADRRAVDLLARAGFPCTTSMANAAKAIRAMYEYRGFLERREGVRPRPARGGDGEADVPLEIGGVRTRSFRADGGREESALPDAGSVLSGAFRADGGRGEVVTLPDAGGERAALPETGGIHPRPARTGEDGDEAAPPAADGTHPRPALVARPPAGGSLAQSLREAGPVMCEHDAKALLSAHGIAVPAGGLAASPGEATRIASALGGPVAMKVQSEDLPHKTESGGIALGVEGETAVREAFGRIMESARASAPAANIEGVRVERMAGAGVEMIVGVSRDPDFGPMLAVGLGGVFVEVLDDVVLSPIPVDAAEARRMLRGLRGRRLLEGVRGAPPADTDALVALLVAVSGFAAAAGDALEALDLNPVIVHPRGQGVSVADAGIVTGPVKLNLPPD